MAELVQTQTHKRKRSDSLESLAIPPIKRAIHRHESLWYEDGNFAVLAEDVHFRLHRSILSLHSEVFRDMFTSPAIGVLESLDGCPLVHLTDRASDLSLFFTALYGAGKKSWYNPKVSVPFPELRTVLTLGMKYQVQHLVDEALHRLRQCFPSSLSEWDLDLHIRDKFPPINIRKVDAIAVVNLARRFNLDDLLPCAFYTLCQLPKGLILAPVQYGVDDREQLSPPDLRRCLDGLDHLLDIHHNAQDVLLSPLASGSCRYPDTCQSLLGHLPGRFLAARLVCGYNPLIDYVPWLGQIMQYIPGRLCSACDVLLKDRLQACRRKVWDELRAIFALI